MRFSMIPVLGALLLSVTLPATAAVGSAMVRTTFEVEGMHCDGCSATIAGSLQRIEGVTDASADHERGVATAVYDSKRVKTEKLKAEIEKLGYTVTRLTTEPVEA